jgi:Protein of unknown function (DUF2934)
MKRIEQERLNHPPRRVPADLENDIRRRAYEIYEERGMIGGSEIDDWLRAEVEVLERKSMQRAA